MDDILNNLDIFFCFKSPFLKNKFFRNKVGRGKIFNNLVEGFKI